MKVLVTGGAGFIGSHLVDQLRERGHTPIVVDDLSTGNRANLPGDVPFFQIDLRDEPAVARLLDEVRPEAISHQAAQMSVSRSVREPAFDAQVNVLGLLNVLQNAVRVGTKKFVFASSGGVLYGDVETPADEQHPAAPISPYGISKWVGEKYLQFFAREHGLETIALRYANVYGPRQNPHGEAGVVAIFCERLFAGEAARINGDGRYIRDYVYCTDVARANVLALEATHLGPFTPFNVGTSIPTDVNQLAEHLRSAIVAVNAKAGRVVELPPLHYGPARAGDLRSSLVNWKAIHQSLGWSPTVSLRDGLELTVEWEGRKVVRQDAGTRGRGTGRVVRRVEKEA